jgi:hypothetical protein
MPPTSKKNPTTQLHADSPSTRQTRVSVKLREFDLPPVGDAVVIGKRAPIGPRALLESLERMLPGVYEMVPVEDHSVVEAVIINQRCTPMLERDRIVKLVLQNAAPLMHESSMLQVSLEAEVTIQVELDE